MTFQRILIVLVIMTIAGCNTQEQIFTEKDGVLMIEMESILMVENWQVKTEIDGYSGDGYITWIGDEYFNDSSHGRMEYPIRITNPGTYMMKWYTMVGRGTDDTEHNDTWFKIDDAAAFYGLREDGNIVRPHGVCTDDCPQGSGHDGYFKVYGAFHDRWWWHASTSDHDMHDIMVEFDEPGIYTIKIAARSSWHFIDKMVLFNVDMTTLEEATANL
jgi:hypothetical protein